MGLPSWSIFKKFFQYSFTDGGPVIQSKWIWPIRFTAFLVAIDFDWSISNKETMQAFRVFFPSLFSLSLAQFSGRVRRLSAEDYSDSG